MNKTELITVVAQKTDLSKRDAERVVKTVFDTITEELAKGDKVQVIGFGTFEVRERQAREGRNPQNGESITIAASKSPAFKAGKQLKDKEIEVFSGDSIYYISKTKNLNTMINLKCRFREIEIKY